MQLSILDLLRAFAVICVLISHTPVFSDYFGEHHLNKLGVFGVGIFFVHTFLVLLISFEKNINNLKFIDAVIKFLIERFFRIYPLSLVVVLVCFIFPELFIDFNPSYFDLFSSIALIQNISGAKSIPGTLWSLPFEIQMYLMLPFIYALFVKKSTNFFIFFILFITCSASFLLWFFSLRYGILSFIPCFLCGLISFKFYRLNITSKSLKNSSFFLIQSLTWPFFLGFLVILSITFSKLIFYTNILKIPEAFVLWPFCFLLSICLPFFNQILQLKVKIIFYEIARYSYSIYLLHAPIINFCFYYLEDLNLEQRFIYFLILLFIGVFLTYQLIEKPMMLIGKKISHSLFNKN